MIDLGDKNKIKNFVYEREDLEKLTTEQLISFIRHIGTWHRAYFRDYHYDDDYEARFKEYIDKYVLVREIWPDNYPIEYYWADEEVLREILKTRPNIPNKIQRKNMIKKKISESKRHTKRHLLYSK